MAVLFADLTNVSQDTEGNGQETDYNTVQTLLQRLTGPVLAHGGQIDRYTGEGLVARFEAQSNREEDAARALRAALDMQRLMVEPGEALAGDAKLRVGIDSEQTANPPSDGSTADENKDSVQGQALADRLQNAARPGTVLVSESIFRRGRARFVFSEALSLNLGGLGRPVVGYEVLGQRLAIAPERGLSNHSTPLVGRGTEADALVTALQRLELSRQGICILITGEAGIGKTRLVQEVLAPANEQLQIIQTECSPNETAGYSLLKTILAALLGISPDQPTGERLDRFETNLGKSPVLLREIGPILKNFLEIGESFSGPNMDPQQEQRRLFGAARRLIAWAARRQPLAIILDDLQWADATSLDGIAHFSDLVQDTPLALIALARPIARERLSAALRIGDQEQASSFVEYELGALPPGESAELLGHILADVPVPHAMQISLLERSAGNPLLLEEITRRLLDQEVIYKTDAGWEVRFDWANAISQVPVTVNGLVLSRYDRLPRYLQQVLDIAAVFKRQFSVVELAAMTDVKDSVLVDWIHDLQQADIFRPVLDSRQARFGFRHPLLREAIYQTIPRPQRQALHLKVANVVQQLASADSLDTIEQVAFHLEQGRSPLAASFLKRAAIRAADRYANQEAIDYYRRLQGAAEQDDHLRVDVAVGLGELLVRVNQPEAARDELGQALELALGPHMRQYRVGDIWYRLAVINADRGNQSEATEAFGKAAAMLESAPETCHTFTLTDIERELGWNLCNQARYKEAQQHAARALTEGLVQGNQGAVAAAHNLRSVIAFYLGQLQEAVASATEALTIREQLNDVWGSASTQTNLGTLYYKLGQWTTAESYLRQAMFVQQEIGDRYTLGLSRNTLSLLLLASGRLDEALLLLDQALASYGGEAEPSALLCLLWMNRGLAHSRLGHGQLAVRDLETCLSLGVALNSDNLRILALAYLAEAHFAQGDLEEAHRRLAEADALEQAAPSPGNRAEIARIQSEIQQADRAWQAALAANRQAASLYKELGETHEYARSQAAWAGIELNWQAVEPDHRIDPACEAALREAAEVFKTLRAQADIVATDALLVRLVNELGSLRATQEEMNRPFVVAVAVQLVQPTLSGGEAEEAAVANALDDMVTAVKRKGQEFGAVINTGVNSLSFVFSTSESAEADIWMLRAVQCAVAAREIASRLNMANRLKLDIEIWPRIGVAAGSLRLGAVSTPTAVATTIEDRAEVLAGAAPANQIYVTQELVSAVGLLYNLETVAQPDSLQPGSIYYRLGQARSSSALAHKLPGSTSQLVGRTLELATLRSWVDRSLSLADGQVCYIEAEAGMGKTRLQAEVLTYAQAHMVCLSGKCELHRSSISYWAFTNMLAALPIAESPASRKLKTVLGLLPPEADDAVMVRSLSPANLRQELLGRLREFLLQVTASHPLLIVIEDIHWLDLSSLDLLDYLLPILREAPISLLLTARAEMAGPHRALLSKAERICGERYLQIRFSGLAEEDSLGLVRQMLDVPILPRGLGRMLRAYAGHPLSLEEAVRLLIESGHLRRADNRWLLTETRAGLGKELPETYEDLLLARLESLDGETLHVLQAAATLGENVDQSLLAAIVPGPGAASALSELVDRGWLLLPEADTPLLYRFKHTLTRETIHATLLTSKNRILHQRAGEAIESLYPDSLEAQVEVLAYHFSQSSQRDKAATYLIRAAEKSATRQALAESLAFYQEAAEILKHSSALTERLGARLQLGLADVYLALGIPVSALSVLAELLNDGMHSLAPEQEGAALQRRAAALRKAGQSADALQAYEAAQSRLTELLNGPALLPAPTRRSVAHELLVTKFGIAQTLFDMYQSTRAAEKLNQLASDIDRAQYPELVAQVLDLQGGLYYRLRQGSAAVQAVRESLSIYQSIGNRAGAAAAYANLGILSANLNELDAASDYFEQSLVLRQALGDAQGLAITRNNLGQLFVREGRFDQALREFEEAGQYARRAGLRQLLGQSLSNHGYALCLRGEAQKALLILNEAEKLCTSYGFKNLLCETTWKRAECLLDGDYLVAAESAARTALTQAVELESKDLQSEARRVLSRIARKINRPDIALTEAEAAWHLRERDGNPILRSRFAAEYGLALAATAKRSDAIAFIQNNVSPTFAYMSASYLSEIESLRTPN